MPRASVWFFVTCLGWFATPTQGFSPREMGWRRSRRTIRRTEPSALLRLAPHLLRLVVVVGRSKRCVVMSHELPPERGSGIRHRNEGLTSHRDDGRPTSWPPRLRSFLWGSSRLWSREAGGATPQSIFGQGLELLWASVQDEAPVTAEVADQVGTGDVRRALHPDQSGLLEQEPEGFDRRGGTSSEQCRLWSCDATGEWCASSDSVAEWRRRYASGLAVVEETTVLGKEMRGFLLRYTRRW